MDSINTIYEKITPIFRDVLENDSLVLSDMLTAEEVPGWDSLAHVNLIVCIENEFDIRFGISELNELKNVGALVRLINSKIS